MVLSFPFGSTFFSYGTTYETPCVETIFESMERAREELDFKVAKIRGKAENFGMGKGLTVLLDPPTKTQPYEPPKRVKVVEPTTSPKPLTLDQREAIDPSHKKTITLKKCCQCQGYGHNAKECPTKKTLNSCEIVHWGGDEILVCEDEGNEVLANEDEEDVKQDRNETEMEVRPYDLVMNGGNSIKVAPNTQIEELALPSQEHPNPYTLGWSTNGSELRGHGDEVLDDLFVMGACHPIFDKPCEPWKYEDDLVHGGKDSNYIFKVGWEDVEANQGLKVVRIAPIQFPKGDPKIQEESMGYNLKDEDELDAMRCLANVKKKMLMWNVMFRARRRSRGFLKWKFKWGA